MISRALEDDFIERVRTVLGEADLAIAVRAYPVMPSEIRNYTPEYEKGEILVRRGRREIETDGVDLRQRVEMELSVFVRALRDVSGEKAKHGGLYEIFDTLIDRLTGYTPTICKGRYVPVSDEVVGYIGEFWVGELIFSIEGYLPHKRR